VGVQQHRSGHPFDGFRCARGALFATAPRPEANSKDLTDRPRRKRRKIERAGQATVTLTTDSLIRSLMACISMLEPPYSRSVSIKSWTLACQVEPVVSCIKTPFRLKQDAALLTQQAHQPLESGTRAPCGSALATHQGRRLAIHCSRLAPHAHSGLNVIECSSTPPSVLLDEVRMRPAVPSDRL
jgi:hypothetical protein